MTLLNFTETVLMVELFSKFLKMGFELEGITKILEWPLLNSFSFLLVISIAIAILE